VKTRAHGKGRAFYYGCSGYHERGRTVCTNNADVPMPDADNIVIEALLDDLLDPDILRDATEKLCNCFEVTIQAISSIDWMRNLRRSIRNEPGW
jgi:acetolactate synthase regulatory subunit